MTVSGRQGLLACVAVFGATLAVSAEPMFTVARHNPDPELTSSFTLSFTDFEFETEAFISKTDLVLKIDPALETSRLLGYDQEIGALIIPTPQGGVSTGDLHVVVLPGPIGTYDPAIQQFDTTDEYAVHFTGDLSIFGIESPFVLPSTSVGVLDFVTANSGTIEMIWEGADSLPNLADPEHPIEFTYTCRVNTLFQIVEPGDFDGDVDVDLADFGFFQLCVTADGQGYRNATCEMADFDHDGDVDILDYPEYRERVTGPQG